MPPDQNMFQGGGGNVSIPSYCILLTTIPQQCNFIGKLEKYNCVIIFFIAEKQQKTSLTFL